MSNLYTGSINTNGEYVNLAELTGLTFVKDTVYAIQIQNVAWLREGTDGQGFLFNRDKGYPWKCTGDDLYIRTTLADTIVNIAENSGFFLNKSNSGGGSTAKNTAIIQKDNVERECDNVSTVYTLAPDYTNIGGVTVSSANIASSFASDKYLKTPNFQIDTNAKIEFFTKVYVTSTGGQFICTMGSTRFGIGISGKWKLFSSIGNTIGTASITLPNWYNLHLVQENATTELYANDVLVVTAENGTIFTLNEDFMVLGTSVIWESFSGTIDLTETKLLINGINVWNAIKKEGEVII